MSNHIVVYKQHTPHKVKRHPLKTFKVPKIYDRIDPDRVVGCHLVSNRHGKELRTSLVAANFYNSEHDITIETIDCDNPVIKLFNHILQVYGEHDTPSRTKQREVRQRDNLPNANGSYRDGRRKVPPPVILVFNDLEAALGRLFRNNLQFRRSVMAGQKSTSITIDDCEIEIAQLTPGGSGCSFEVYVRKDRQIVRIFGRSIKGYLSENSDANAESFLGHTDDIPIPGDWSRRQWNSLSADEQELLRQHVAREANIARELYECFYEELSAIDPHIVRRNKSLPNSIAGAGAKIAFSMSSKESFDRPSDRVTQMGALSYAGGRQFIHASPDEYNDLYLYDAKSFHGFLMMQPPDPATCEYIDINPGAFHIEQWLGQFGAMCISGTVHDTLNPPIRDHDFTTRRLRYVTETFIRTWASIPEIVLGVISGRLSVTHIHDGIHMVGSNEQSFLRKFALKMNAIKESAIDGSPRYTFAKLLMNAVPGKLAEINSRHPYIDSTSRRAMVPVDSFKHRKDLLDAYYKGNEQLEETANRLFAESKHPDTEITFGTLLDRYLPHNATTGAYYLPMHAVQITGMSSALLGLAASYTNAISGYTDSLITIGDASTGLAKYRSIVQEAGYEAPETGMGSFQSKIEEGYGYIVKPGLWVIRWEHIDKQTGEVTTQQKEALHGLADLGDKDPWDVIHHIVDTKHYSYSSQARPAHLMEAYRAHIEPGTPISQSKTLHTTPKKTEITTQEVNHSRQLVQDATDYLSHTSSHDVPTNQTAMGCIKMLSNLGLDYSFIAEATEIPLNTIKAIASGRRPGDKHLAKLQKLVAEVEPSFLAAS